MQKQRKFKQRMHNGQNPATLLANYSSFVLDRELQQIEFKQNDRVRRFFIISITQCLTIYWKVYSNQLVVNLFIYFSKTQ